MGKILTVNQVIREKTHVGKVNFPTSVPEGLSELITLPSDLEQHARKLGLNEDSVRFVIGILRGKCAMTASVNLPELAPKLNLDYATMDEIIRDLIKKNYARLNDRLDLYRLWVVILHLKGTKFAAED